MKVHIYTSGKNFDGTTHKFERDVNGEETAKDVLKELKLYQITVAKEVLAEEISKGFDKGYQKRIDGVVGKDEESVRILGKIEYITRLDFTKALTLVYEKLLEKSASESGHYKNSHVVFCNGKVVASSLVELQAWASKVLPEQDFTRPVIVRFVNLAAYARRLELLGATIKGMSGRTKTVHYRNKKHGGGSTRIAKMPNGTYYLVYRVVRSQLKALSGVGEGTRFEFITGDTFGIGDMSIARGFKRDRFVKSGRNYLYPSIVLELSTSTNINSGV